MMELAVRRWTKKNPCNNKWWCIALMVYAAVSRMFWPCVAGSAWSTTQEDSVRQRHSTSDRWGSESSNGKQRNVEGWRRCPGQLETPLWEEQSGLIEWKRTQPVFLVKSKLMSDTHFDLGRVSTISRQACCFTRSEASIQKSRSRVPKWERFKTDSSF